MPTIANVSVVIPTLNEERSIVNILNDLHQQTIQPKEIIVVDGGSEDKTISKAKKFRHVIVLQNKANPSIQRNTGWLHAISDLILFLDADTRCQQDFIQNSMDEFQQRQLDTACPRYIPSTADTRIKIIYSVLNMLFKAGEILLPSGAGSCIITKKKILKKIGGFNALYTYDDIYFLRNAARIGRFRMLHTKIYVSPRRFEKYGIWTTMMRYIILSVFFTFGLHQVANRVSYPFGKYDT